MRNLLQERMLSLFVTVMLPLISSTVYGETPPVAAESRVYSPVETGKEVARLLHSLKRSGAHRIEIVWSPDGTKILSSSWDRQHVLQRRRAGGRWAFEPATITIHDVKSGKALRVIKLGGLLSETRGSGPTCLAWSPDGLMFATGHEEGYRDDTVRIWDAKTGKEIITFKGHGGNVESVGWSPDGKKLASSGTGTVRIWDPSGDEEPVVLRGETRMSWSPDGARMSTCYSRRGGIWGKGRVTVWDTTAWEVLYSLSGQLNPVWSPDGAKLATNRIRVQAGLQFCAGSEHVHRAIVEGRHPGHANSIVRVWDAASGDEIHALKVPGYSVNTIAWSPDGSKLASCGNKYKDKTERHYGFRSAFYEGLVVIWDANSGRQLHKIEDHKYYVADLAWSPNGRKLASCDGLEREIFQTGPYALPVVVPPEANRVKIWDAVSGEELHRLRNHPARVFDVSWNPDGTKLASTDSVGISRIWSIPK